MRKTAGALPMPKNTSDSGTQAVTGMLRSTCMVGSSTRSMTRERPIKSPARIPSAPPGESGEHAPDAGSRMIDPCPGIAGGRIGRSGDQIVPDESDIGRRRQDITTDETDLAADLPEREHDRRKRHILREQGERPGGYRPAGPRLPFPVCG